MDREHPEHLEVHHAESQLQAEGWNNALGQVKKIWESQDVEYEKILLFFSGPSLKS